MFAIGDSIYVGGGSGLNDFYSYCPATGNWTSLGTLPRVVMPGEVTTRSFAVSFVVGTKAYVGLGQANAAQVSVLGDLWEFDPASGWKQKADFPGKKRNGAFAFALSGKGYVGGGAEADGTALPDDFYSYDPTADKWTALRALPFGGICFPATFALGDSGYVVGGSIFSFAQQNSMWKYDPSSDLWTAKDSIPFIRETPVGFALNGLGYVGSGQTQYKKIYNDFYSYDPSTDSWTSVSPLPVPRVSVSTTSIVFAQVKVNTSASLPVTIHNSPGRFAASGTATSTHAFVGFGRDFTLGLDSDLWQFSTKGTSTDSLRDTIPTLAAPFSTSFNVGIRSLAAGDSTTISVRFAPTAAGSASDRLIITSNAPAPKNRIVVSISATAVASGVDDPHLLSDQLFAYPNPTDGLLTISSPADLPNTRIVIRNAIGAIAFDGILNAQRIVDMRNLPAGLYDLEITSDSYHASQHIIKE